MQKEFDKAGQHLLHVDLDVRQGQTITLSHNHYKDKFHGPLWASGDKRIFRGAGTPCQVEVRVHEQVLPYQESKWVESQLYKAVRAEHVKANKKLSQAQLRTTFGERMPKEPADLVVRGTTAVGKLIYVWNNVEVEVTPRRTRENPNEDMSHSWQAKLREATPTRALRKMREKMRREAKKAAQGKHAPIVVQYTDKGKHEDARVAPATVVTPQVGIPTNTALASLHDPEGLAHARAAYEFLDSARLLHCRNCDEEWIFSMPRGPRPVCSGQGRSRGSARPSRERGSRPLGPTRACAADAAAAVCTQ